MKNKKFIHSYEGYYIEGVFQSSHTKRRFSSIKPLFSWYTPGYEKNSRRQSRNGIEMWHKGLKERLRILNKLKGDKK